MNGARENFKGLIVFFTCAGSSLLAAIAVLGVSNAATSNTSVRASWLAHPVSPNLGGQTTVDQSGERAFKSVAANAEGMSMARFTFGKQLFETVWEPAPGSQPTTDGLGPVFNRSACAQCHIGNGRGRPPAVTDDAMDSILVRLSIEGIGMHGGPKPVPDYGDQLQDRGIADVPAEGMAQIVYDEVSGQYADGTEYSLRKPTVKFVHLAFGDLPAGVMTSARVASPVIGLGLLEAVPEESLHALADPDDHDGDGISGRVNVVWDAVNKKEAVGRFGWKANAPSLQHQNAAAAIGDMGITSPVFGEDLCEPVQKSCSEVARDVADSPELLSSFFDPLLRYTQLVAVPKQRDADHPEIQRGASTFRGLGCAFCHLPTLKTGPSELAELAELAEQVIHPFSDLLLHDMGEGLADNRPDFLASGREWRTAPLWGIGLTEAVGGFQFYLHDGRARSLAEAILWHDGEAARARKAFKMLSAAQRADLYAFLGSL